MDRRELLLAVTLFYAVQFVVKVKEENRNL
jgi:hypothetical protein